MRSQTFNPTNQNKGRKRGLKLTESDMNGEILEQLPQKFRIL